MEAMRKLPIGIQTFEEIRKEGYLYVDKTAFVYQLVSSGKPYFLSRPRRFGKSLFLTTLESYFQGRKDLFEGLAIERLEKDWIAYPVLHMDLNAEKYDAPERLVSMLNRYLTVWEEAWGKSPYEETPSDRFTGIIRRAYERTGRPVVVLIDEYDKPLLQALLDASLLEEYRRTLKAFYGVLKSADRYLRFVFLTGVTKFAQVSVFSDLNQLQDISAWPDYSAVCGITREELLRVFTPEIESLARANGETFEEMVDEMTRQYDGYHFFAGCPGVFNPFSVLNAFKSKVTENFWFQTGTPTYLADLLKESDYDLRLLIDGVEVASSAFSEYRAEASNPLPMIYQSGYLTIKDYDKGLRLYTLGFPNDEVRYGFLNFLLPYYTRVTTDETSFHIATFIRELRAGKVDSFMSRVKVFFAGIPYELSDNTERHYQTIFYVIFTLMGQFTEAEVRSSHGRADAVVKTRDTVYVFEFKLNGTAEEALRQIDTGDYLIPYQLSGKRLVKVGVEFSKETRNISRYLVG